MVVQVRWTADAVKQLQEAVEFIATDSSVAAQQVAETIYSEIESLSHMPHRGRLGAVPGTRELVIVSVGYIVTYEVIRDAVFVLRLHHGAQNRPRR